MDITATGTKDGKEFGLGRDRRIAITEAIQANIELLSGSRRESLIDRIKGADAITLHAWLGRYETILSERGIRLKTLLDYASKIRAIRRKLPDKPLADISTKEVAAMLKTPT